MPVSPSVGEGGASYKNSRSPAGQWRSYTLSPDESRKVLAGSIADDLERIQETAEARERARICGDGHYPRDHHIRHEYSNRDHRRDSHPHPYRPPPPPHDVGGGNYNDYYNRRERRSMSKEDFARLPPKLEDEIEGRILRRRRSGSIHDLDDDFGVGGRMPFSRRSSSSPSFGVPASISRSIERIADEKERDHIIREDRRTSWGMIGAALGYDADETAKRRAKEDEDLRRIPGDLRRNIELEFESDHRRSRTPEFRMSDMENRPPSGAGRRHSGGPFDDPLAHGVPPHPHPVPMNGGGGVLGAPVPVPPGVGGGPFGIPPHPGIDNEAWQSYREAYREKLTLESRGEIPRSREYGYISVGQGGPGTRTGVNADRITNAKRNAFVPPNPPKGDVARSHLQVDFNRAPLAASEDVVNGKPVKKLGYEDALYEREKQLREARIREREREGGASAPPIDPDERDALLKSAKDDIKAAGGGKKKGTFLKSFRKGKAKASAAPEVHTTDPVATLSGRKIGSSARPSATTPPTSPRSRSVEFDSDSSYTSAGTTARGPDGRSRRRAIADASGGGAGSNIATTGTKSGTGTRTGAAAAAAAAASSSGYHSLSTRDDPPTTSVSLERGPPTTRVAMGECEKRRDQLEKIALSSQGWGDLEKAEFGVEITSKLFQAMDSHCYRSRCVIDAPADKVFNFLSRMEFDPQLLYGEVIQRIDRNHEVINVAYDSGGALSSDRDFVIFESATPKEDGSYTITYHSINHPGCPEKDYTRGLVKFGGYVILPSPSRPMTTILICVIQIDAAGWMTTVVGNSMSDAFVRRLTYFKQIIEKNPEKAPPLSRAGHRSQRPTIFHRKKD